MHPLATLVYFQLKYCERCGGLWLRPDGAATPFCPNCERIMAALPLRARRPNRKIVPATCVPAALALLSTVVDVAQLISVCVA
ncbi:MAG: hypothetical protein WCC59_19605 [Terriglobales bacterium]